MDSEPSKCTLGRFSEIIHVAPSGQVLIFPHSKRCPLPPFKVSAQGLLAKKRRKRVFASIVRTCLHTFCMGNIITVPLQT